MPASHLVWRRRARILGGLAAPVLLSLVPHATAAEPPPLPAAAVTAPAAAAPQVFDLHACREYAVEHQPAVAAARASLAAAQMKAEALERMRFAAVVARDLPIRRKQAALGVTIAQAALDAAEADARHSAAATYLAALYALEQQKTADSIQQRLTDLRTLAQAALDDGKRKDVSQEHINEIDGFLKLLDGRRQEAVEGYDRALAALREALGLGPDCAIIIADKELPDIRTKADRDVIVQLAVSRRGEVVEAATAVNVCCLEVEAQGAILLSPARTFALGGDIHSQVLPSAQHDPEYRPGAVAPEMPPTLIGNRRDRQDIAEAYHARAGAVADKTRNLIGLEAEDGYLRWKQNDDAQPSFDAAATQLDAYSHYLSDKFTPDKEGYPGVDDVLGAGLKSVQARLDANQAKYRRLAALANLERLTGGGFDPGFDAVVAAPQKPKH